MNMEKTTPAQGPIERGGYVVMRHSGTVKRMHCSVVRPDYEGAHAEAQRLYTDLVTNGHDPARLGLYILRIVDRVRIVGRARDVFPVPPPLEIVGRWGREFCGQTQCTTNLHIVRCWLRLW